MFSHSVATSSWRRRSAVVVACLWLVGASCGDSGADTTTTQQPESTADTAAPPTVAATTVAPTTVPPTTTTVPPTTTTPPTTAPAPQLPETGSTAVLGEDPTFDVYKIDLETSSPIAIEPGELPAEPGEVEVRWYTAEGRYVYALVGFDPSAAGGLCPGGSIFTAGAFEDVSNAPTESGACEGFTTVTDDSLAGPRVCQNILFYVTLIDSATQGDLYASLEGLASPGVLIGLTSSTTSAGATELDLAGFCG